MPVRLSTTVSKIALLPNSTNAALMTEFYQYMKNIQLSGIKRQNPQNNLPSQNTDGLSSSSGISETNPSSNQLTDNNRYYKGLDWTGVCNKVHSYGIISQPCDTLITPDGNALTSQGKQVMENELCPRGQGVLKC
jgi:hypothetical protein